MRFTINGQVHYGWALVKAEAGVFEHKPRIKAALLGYVYDTVAGQTITAGEGAADSEKPEATSQSGTLGMLALGWPAWRRKEEPRTERPSQSL